MMTMYGVEGSVIDRRQHFRIVYPREAAPSIIVGGMVHRVLDLSEAGVRFLKTRIRDFAIKEEVDATLVFHDNDQLMVRGTIIRIRMDQVVMVLDGHLTYKKIFDEQVHLRRNYGWNQ
jgi:hypothetical protein